MWQAIKVVAVGVCFGCSAAAPPGDPSRPLPGLITVQIQGDGLGTIVLDAIGATGGTCRKETKDLAQCKFEVPVGTRATLSAKADQSFLFKGWYHSDTEGVPCRFGIGPCEVEIMREGESFFVDPTFEPRCTPQGWCHEIPIPSGSPYYRDIWGSSSTDVWLFGTDVVHWDGTSYAKIEIPTEILGGAWGSSAHDVWTVGRGGILVHWDGSVWSVVPSGSAVQLHDTFGSGDRDVWAVGDGGTILHWDGVAWMKTKSGITHSLRAVWGSGPRDFFAVGDKGTVLRWDGSGWYFHFLDTVADFKDVWGGGPTDVWTVASSAGPFGSSDYVFRWNGVQWSSDASDYAFSSLWGSGPDDLWGIGGQFFAYVLHWNGRSWLRSDLSWASQPSRVWGSGRRDVWAVGRGVFRFRPQPG